MTSQSPLTLVVLAAGMGSRYGGLKQLDPVGPHGEVILDYSVYDAIQAGFTKVVFVIRRDFEELFREKIVSRYEQRIEIVCCYQDLADLPAGYAVPEGRAKPWGTAHATRAARAAISGPFAVINADDFYGRDAFVRLAEYLRTASEGAPLACAMVGFRLENTLSDFGSVARGVCCVDPAGQLKGVVEMTKLVKTPTCAENREDPNCPESVPFDARVSMNFWGFTPQFMAELEKRFPLWLKAHGAEVKSEWYLPFVVDEMIHDGTAVCQVLPTNSRWFGVTYHEDKAFVVQQIGQLVHEGVYPQELF